MAIELRNINPAVFDYNVGIGTASPASPLHVYGTTNDGSSLTILTQLGTGRGQYIIRDVAAATRALVNIVQSHASGGAEAALDIQQTTTASDALRITNNGSTVTSSITGAGTGYFAGNVGIGTTNPGQKLSISSSATNYTLVNIINTSTGGYNWNIGSVGSDATLATVGSLVFRDSTNGVTRMSINSAGYVGIGTTSPGTPLDVVFSSNTARFGSSAGGNNNIRVTSGAALNVGIYTGSGRAIWADGDLRFYTGTTTPDPTTHPEVTLSERIRILSTGNVGIGTASPGYKLTVKDGSSQIAATDGTSAIGFINASSAQVQFGASTAIPINFAINGTNLATILPSGYVGIGTTTPVSPLNVYKISGAGGPSLGSDATGIVTISSHVSQALQIGTYNASPYGMWFQGKQMANDGVSTYPLIFNPLGGNVGIGITSPTEKLHVEGNLKINGLLKFPDGSSYPSAAASASRAMACPIDGARGVYDNDVLWLWDGTYRTVNEAQYYIGRTESHATDGGSARVLDVLTTTGGGTFSDTGYYTTTWNSNYMIGVNTAASVGAPTTWVTATLPCDPSVHNVLHVKVISTDRWQSVGAYILNSSGALQSKLQTHSNANVGESGGDISTVGPRNSAAKTTCCHEWVSIIIPKAHLTSRAYANINSPTGYSVKIALYNGHSSSASVLYIAGLGISRNPTGFVHINAIDLHWATNGGGTTNWNGNWNYDSMARIIHNTNYSDIRIPIAGTDRDILIGCVDHGNSHRGPGAIFWLNNYNQPSIPNATFYLSNLVTGTYGKMNIGYKYRGFSGFVVPKALVQAYVQTNLGQQYLSFYIYNQNNNYEANFRAMYSEQVNRIGNSKSITGAAFNMKNSNYKAAEIVDISTYDGY